MKKVQIKIPPKEAF